MRSTNRKRTLIVAGAVILLCMTIIVGSTFALFTDTRTVKNHLQAGDLSITLTRTNLTKTTLDGQGYLVEEPTVTTDVDFSAPTTENVFGLITDAEGNVTERIVPGSKFVAEMEISNNSDVAFGYWVEIVCTDKTLGAKLAEQVKVTVKTDSDNSAAVGEGLKVGSDTAFIDVVPVGGSDTFIVTVEFVDAGYTFVDGVLSSTNNDAKLQSLDFDLVVYAIQEPTNPNA